MKTILLSLALSLIYLSNYAKEVVTIQPNSTFVLDAEKVTTNRIQIRNMSTLPFDVSVRSTISKEWIKGFGMAPKGKATISIDFGQELTLINKTSEAIEVTLHFINAKTPRAEQTNQQPKITFTLHNSTGQSIPLIIPNVMNPNLSPYSNSGVSLAVGQKIYCKTNGKRQLILVVDDTIRQGEKIDVAQLIEAL
ncbi:MAG: hypothetical protein ACFB10_17270 [Salibacteraceae bacterium]